MRHTASVAALAVSLVIILACTGASGAPGGGGGGGACSYAGLEFTSWDLDPYGSAKYDITFKQGGDAYFSYKRGSLSVNDGTWDLSGDHVTAVIDNATLEMTVLDGCSMGGTLTFTGGDDGPAVVPYRGSRTWPACGCR